MSSWRTRGSCPLFGEASFADPANVFVAVSYPDQLTAEIAITRLDRR